MKWTEKDIEYLKREYSNKTNKTLSNEMARKTSTISRMAGKLNLLKSKQHMDNLCVVWMDSEIDYLKNNYANTKNEELSKLLCKKISDIKNKAHKLKLNKSKEHISRNISQRNKMVGSNYTISELKKIASVHKTKYSFRKGDSSAYYSSIRKEILDEICIHMIPQSYSIPQLICKSIFDTLTGTICEYDTRKIIPPYELDIFYPEFKLGIEYNGKRWHIDDNTDTKIKLCEANNILLIVIKENNRMYESDIKKQIINNLHMINNKIGLNLTESDVHDVNISSDIFSNLLDETEIFSVTNRYTDYTTFYKNEQNLYQKIKRLKQLDKYTSHMSKSKIYWDAEMAKNIIDKYTHLQNFIDKEKKCYAYIKRNKLEHLLVNLLYKNKISLNRVVEK